MPNRPMRTRNILIIGLGGLFLYLALLPVQVAECGAAEERPTSPESLPVIPGPPPAPQEQLLSPIPQQFDWMRREVLPNPLLQSLLGLQGVTGRLLITASLTEEYSDNFFQTAGDPQDNFRTSLNIGTVYHMDRGPSFMSLANSVSANYDTRLDVANIPFANLSLNVGHQLARLSLALSESLIRSDQPEDVSPTGIRRSGQKFLQNIVSPQVHYTFTPTTEADFIYTNALVFNEGQPQRDDSISVFQGNSTSHSFTTDLQHRFTPVLSSRVGYTYTTTDSDQSGDTHQHLTAADLGYVFDARTGISLRLFSNFIESGGGGSVGIPQGRVNLYGASIGVRRQLTSFLTAFVAVGPTLTDSDTRAKRLFANWQASLEGGIPITRLTTLTLSTTQSINDTAGDIADVGLVQSRSATISLNHQFSRDLLGSIFATYAQTQPLEDISANGQSLQNSNFTFWSTGASASYALTRLLALTATYRYQHGSSPVSASGSDGTQLGGDYAENRLTITLSAAFPAF
jgi:opacity protein-like surface antigen